MPFCRKCGTQLSNDAKFCNQCGTPAAAPQPVQPGYQPPYRGTEYVFPLMGATLVVSPEMDVFNHYRLEFRRLALLQSDKLERDYRASINNLDAFLIDFPNLYCRHRKPLLDYAVGIFLRNEMYDISVQQFEEQHNADFCLCGEDVSVMIDSFNKTIEANQEAKARGYNMIPGVIFGGGIAGFAAAFAMNAAVTAIAEADIRNADVTPKQRVELFNRIDTNLLMERAYLDYWRVFLSMTWQMNRRGLGVWYPNETDNQRAEGLYQNISSGRIPEEKMPELIVTMLGHNPYVDEYLQYVYRKYGVTPETQAIFDYFGFRP